MHGKHERSAESGKKEIRLREVTPFTVAVPPAERKDREDPLARGVGFLVAKHCDVGDQADVEERGRDSEVRRDRENVPHERRLEIREQETPVRIRQQPEELPRAPDVNDRKETGRHDREHRHRLGGAVDRGSKAGAEEEQDGRDERTGVTDTYPEHERDDVVAPHHRRFVSSLAEPPIDLIHPGGGADQHRQDGSAEAQEPLLREAEGRDDIAIDLLVIFDGGELYVGRRNVRPTNALTHRIPYGCHVRCPQACAGEAGAG